MPFSITAVQDALNLAEPEVRTPKSPYERLHDIEEHFHAPTKCYPSGTDGVTVTAGDAAPWTLGAFTEIIPAGAITDVFDIHFITPEAVSAAGSYEIVLYAATTEIGRTRFGATGTPNNIIFPDVAFQTDKLAAGTQVQARLMSSTGDADTIVMSLDYHLY